MKTAVMFMLLLIAALSGCGREITNPQIANVLATPQHSQEFTYIQPPITPSENAESLQIKNYSNYYHNLNILRVYGIDKDRISKIIYSINPIYFEELELIEAIHSKSELRQKAGMYYPDSGKITLYIDWESDEWIKHNLLHELKHHYCYTNNYKWNSTEEAHQGCFFDTPIDKEYGFIR